MMTLELKLVIHGDWKEIAGMMQEFYTDEGYPFNIQNKHDYYDKFLSNPELGRLWKLEVDGHLAGYAILAFGFSFEYGKDALIDELFLKKDFRSKGFGAKALELIISQAEHLGIETLHLEVEKHNKTASHLYSKYGFRDKNRTLMSKTLN